MVKINNILCSERKISNDLLQGTVMGPLPFSLYMSNFLTIPCDGSIFSFADDTAILFSAADWDTLKIKVENEITYLKTGWVDYKSITINYEKSHFLLFASYENGIFQQIDHK